MRCMSVVAAGIYSVYLTIVLILIVNIKEKGDQSRSKKKRMFIYKHVKTHKSHVRRNSKNVR